jgi:hypothetical protein
MLFIPISLAYETKLQGIIIQSNIKWNTHIRLSQIMISKTISILTRVNNILTTAHLKNLYLTLAEPYLNYYCIVWATPVKTSKPLGLKRYITSFKNVQLELSCMPCIKLTQNPYSSHKTSSMQHSDLKICQSIV